MNSALKSLREIGQSIWYDNLSKEVLDDGSLENLVGAGVSGLTSNPTIFKKAIADSNLYDSAILTLKTEGLDHEAITEKLMIEDVGRAADLLRKTYDQSGGADGYASIEVSPLLARDTEGTIKAARRIWKSLDRPNIMIKIPATKAGLPAIKAALSEGMNVNITLIFSVERYSEVIDQYLAALRERVAKGEDISRIASVASFFVSRVDSIVEKSISRKESQGDIPANSMTAFLGKVGIANSVLAYELFEKRFRGSEVDDLKKIEHRVQRPLWASTGTKNPDFDPLLYVKELAGSDTVNTLPPQTLEILMKDNAIKAALPGNADAARSLVSELAEIKVALAPLLVDLEEEGVLSFATSYTELLKSVETKMKAL